MGFEVAGRLCRPLSALLCIVALSSACGRIRYRIDDKTLVRDASTDLDVRSDVAATSDSRSIDAIADTNVDSAADTAIDELRDAHGDVDAAMHIDVAPAVSDVRLADSPAIDALDSTLANDAFDGVVVEASTLDAFEASALDAPSGPRCGDGIVQISEECDDMNDIPTDFCRECRVAFCGDGILNTFEGCDDSNTTSGDGCSAFCLLEQPGCGDGTVRGAEECDDGNTIDTDNCVRSCRFARCGDGFVQPGEQCDDANAITGDGCEPVTCVRS